jgi:hypothetical protein
MSEATALLPGVVLGRFHGIDDEGRLRVTFPGADRPVAARAAWMPIAPDWSACAGLRVLLALIDGEPDHPVILGLLDAPAVVSAPALGREESADRAATAATTAVGEASASGREESPTTVEAAADPNPQRHPDALFLNARRELVLQCGKARVSLRADGRIVILGGYLVSRSSGVNKIKGASVQIN